MSDIKVGDLVMVVRTCCSVSAERVMGALFTVSHIGNELAKCSGCGATDFGGLFAFSSEKYGKRRIADMAPISWIKRIPPLSELEGQNEKKELHEIR